MAMKRKKNLSALGADKLAEMLEDIAIHSDYADDLIERTLAGPDKNIQRFYAKLEALKTQSHFVYWKQSFDFASELSLILEDLKAAKPKPAQAIEMLKAFYEMDEAVINNCDDSSGVIGQVFNGEAQELFCSYGKKFKDKKRLRDILLKLIIGDEYGLRDTLIDCASQCLPELELRQMVGDLQKMAVDEADDYQKRSCFHLVESLAKQLKDAKLFEETSLANWGKLSTAAQIDLARVYFESDELESSLEWLEKIPADEYFQRSEKEALLLEIYRKQGKTEEVQVILYRKFRSYRCLDYLENLLEVIGESKRAELLAEELELIDQDENLNLTNAEFLVAIDKLSEAEAYLLKFHEQLNGQFYGSLLAFAEAFESHQKYLLTSLLYRSLLDAILDQGKSKAYYHGVKYLRKLDLLAEKIDDGGKFDSHEVYKESVLDKHKRKRSFWSQYDQ